jgi:membrane protein
VKPKLFRWNIPVIGFKAFLLLVIESIMGWLQDNAMLYAAAVSYFTLFSVVPLVLITVSIASMVFNMTTVQDQLIEMAYTLGGPALATTVEEILQNSTALLMGNSGPLLTLISVGVVIFGATLIFRQLQLSINVMWGLLPEPVKPEREKLFKTVWIVVKKFLIATVAAFSIGFFLVLSLVVNSIGTMLMQFTGLGQWLGPILSFVAVPLVLWLVFMAIFKFLPQGLIRWQDIWFGAAITALLFWLSSYGITIYMAFSTLDTAFGAASSLFVFLIWVFVSASIVLYGAKFIQAYANRYGVPIIPEEGMILKESVPSFALPPQVAHWLNSN